MERPLQITPELRVKQAELQDRLDALLAEAKQYPLRLCWKVPYEHLPKLEKTAQLLQQGRECEFVYLVSPDYYYKIDFRQMSEDEIESRKQTNL